MCFPSTSCASWIHTPLNVQPGMTYRGEPMPVKDIHVPLKKGLEIDDNTETEDYIQYVCKKVDIFSL